ncbi:MAG: tRNA (adenosine(37)-N6)-threonylcarbamoyltransferase complex dimerization subunit type 1 TsaB [Solirubrobacterales bacterium]
MTGSVPHDGRTEAILAIDTALRSAIVALARLDGTPIAETTWVAGYRHGETLLPSIARVLGESNIRRSRLRGIVVGTGPGAFTGLRVGLATAKGLARALGQPIVGVATGDALLLAAAESDEQPAERFALLLPAGPSDRTLVRVGEAPVLLPGGTEPELREGERLVAVDLEDRAPEPALAIGRSAVRGLGQVLLREGGARLRQGRPDDLARLVPEYVTLPRGVAEASGEVAWSRDPR